MQNAVNDVLVKCPKLRKHLKMLGIMFSRENTPVKLNFDIPADVYWDGLKEIQVLLDSVMPMDLCSVVEKLCKDRYMDCSFAVDVFEDGSINPVGGMELSVHEYTVERQNVLIYSPEVSRLWDKLCKYQVVDERYLRLRNITKAKRINFEDAQILYISYLSHIKIRWGKDGLLPVKAYLGADFK